jgi:hypothetical protein
MVKRDSSTAPVALLYRLSDWPCASMLFEAARLPKKLQDIACYIHADADGYEAHLFDRLPEKALKATEDELVHMVNRALRGAADGLVQRVVYEEGRQGSSSSIGFHANAPLDEVAAEFKRDGFHVVMLTDEMAKRSAPDDEATEEAALKRARESLEDQAESEAGKAALAWILESTSLPGGVDLTGCIAEYGLARALNPRVEHWNDVDLRVLDVWVKAVPAPGAIDLSQSSFFEKFEDRHRLVREALVARGVSEERIRADSVAMCERFHRAGGGALETYPCSNSLQLWLLSPIDHLAPTWKSLSSSEHPGRGDWLLLAALKLLRVPRAVNAVKAVLDDAQSCLAVGAKPWLFLLDAEEEEDDEDPVNLEFVKPHLERIAAVADPSVRYEVACALAERTGDDAERRAAVEDCLRTRASAMETPKLWAPFRDACTMEPKLALEHLAGWVGKERETFEEFVSIADDALPAKVPDVPALREQLSRAAVTYKKKRTRTQLEAIVARLSGASEKKTRAKK